MHAFIVSDLHLGSSEARHQDFTRFLEALPAGATLVLNGDIANHATKRQVCESEGTAVVEQLCRESFHRPIVWLSGNNDSCYRPEQPNQIEFSDHLAFGKELYICHGHQFLAFPSRTRWLQKLLGALCRLFHSDTGRTHHMADVLQRVPPLYRLACRIVARGAIRFARRHGYAAITCGHTHHAEEVTACGVRYINTGAWTTPTPSYVVVKDGDIRLEAFAVESGDPASDPIRSVP